MQPPHRKKVRHFDEPGHLHELTFSCYKRLPLLVNDEWCGLLADSIDRVSERHQYGLIAFVFMPEHVHLLVMPKRHASRVSALLKAIKRPFLFRVKKLLADSNSPLKSRLTIQQRSGVNTFRFWQEGPGYDRNLTSPKPIEAAISYIHRNPVERGLCERAIDWHWSSARALVLAESPADSLLPKLMPLQPEYLEMER